MEARPAGRETWRAISAPVLAGRHVYRVRCRRRHVQLSDAEATATTSRRASRVAYDPTGDGRTTVHGSYGVFYDNIVSGVLDVGRVVDGSAAGVRTLVLGRAARVNRLERARPSAHRGPGDGAARHRVSECCDHARAALKNCTRIRRRSGSTACWLAICRQRERRLRARLQPAWHDRLQPRCCRRGSAPSRRPNDLPCSANPQAVCVGGGIPGTSASVLQYTSFGESWYKGLTVALNKRLSRNYQFLLSYTLSSAEDTSTDFQSNFIVQNSGFGRDPADRSGLPLGFDPEQNGARRHTISVTGSCGPVSTSFLARFSCRAS